MNTMQNPGRHAEKVAVGFMTAAVALILESFLWGFTVDDAWIVSRVASHGAEVGQFSFNHAGPVTDAVTPLGWAHILGWGGKCLGLSEGIEFWSLARWLGLLFYGVSFFVAGYFSTSRLNWQQWWRAPLLTLLCVPAAIWAGAGLTAPIVGLILLGGAIALVAGSRRQLPLFGSALLGSACAWRPELGPFILGLLLFSEAFVSGSFLRRALLFGMLGAPTVAVMSFRWALFGHALPLSSIAKTPSFESGLYYAAVTCIWTGLPWLLCLKLVDGSRRRAQVIPWLLHLVALVFVGGDWMPGLRLSAALFPWLVWQITPRLTRPWHAGLLLAAALFPGLLLYQQASDLRAVTTRRTALIEQARPLLKNSQVIAAVDIGWLGLATNATIVDLAGVTDEKIAALPGGHTSKAIYPGLFSGRNVDTWVVRTVDGPYLPGAAVDSIYASYWVDDRLLRRGVDLSMRVEAFLPLEGTTGGYVVLRFDDRKSGSPGDESRSAGTHYE